jgi:hypothetical protein
MNVRAERRSSEISQGSQAETAEAAARTRFDEEQFNYSDRTTGGHGSTDGD